MVAAADEWNLRSRHHQRDRNEKLVVLQPKVGDAEIQRQIGGRHFGCKLFFKLPLFIVRGGMQVIRRCVVATTVLDLQSGKFALYDDAPVVSVSRQVRAVITEQIVSRGVVLDAFEDLAE